MHSKLRNCNRRGATLTEVLMAVPIAALFGILTVTVLAVSAVLFKNITDESLFRTKANRVMTSVEKDLRCSESASIATNYLTAASPATYNGNCVYIVNKTNPVGSQNVAYYYYKGTGWTWGSIFKDSDTSTPPDPDSDQEMARSVTGFEIRRNPTGAGAEYRVAIRGAAHQQRIMGNTSSVGNILLVSSTVRPRRS
ncbi:MAG: hypothetical protein ABI579_07260 [Candidatus Sumerlaeota bacterium]